MKLLLPKPLLLFIFSVAGFLVTKHSLAQTQQAFTTSGTFTVPAGVTTVVVEAWGGGAGGRSTNSKSENGGGGGAYARSVLTVAPGANIPVVVGAGGAIGGAGGNSSFGGAQVVAAGAADQNGGLASASTGQVKFSGGSGGNAGGNGNNSAGGGGGSSASYNANGVPGASTSGSTGGAGGDGPDGDGGRGGDGGSQNIHGLPGTAPGGGGGGKGANGNSGTGAPGQVIVYYYLISGATAASAACPGNATTITLESSSLLAGKTYTFNYTLSGANTGNGTATVIVSAAGTASFQTSSLSIAGNTTLTLTNISTGFLSMAPSGTVTAAITVAAMPLSGTVTKDPSVSGAAVCSGTLVSATATAGSGGAGTLTDVVEYRYDGTGGWSSYTPGTDIPTTGHTKVEIQTFRKATGTSCGSSTPVVINWIINPRPSISIGINESPLTGTQDGTICAGGSVTLTGNGSVTTGPYTYSWATGLGTFSNTQTVTVVPDNTTDYLVTVIDANGCTNNSTQKVTVNALPTATIAINENPLTGTQDGTICAGGSVTLTGNGGTSYAWSGGSTSLAQSITVSPATTTPYTITATDVNGCKGMASQTVSVNPLPVVSFAAAPAAPVCAGNDVTYTTQAGQSNYTWTLPAASEYTLTGGSFSSNTITLHWNSAGSKTVKVNYTNANGCAATTPATNTTTVNALPTLSGVSASTIELCSGSSATITLTGLLASTPQTVTYTINGGQEESVMVTSNSSGTATFNTVALGSTSSELPLVITGITRTDVTPSCNVLNPVNAQTTLPKVTNTDLVAPTIAKPAAINVSSVCAGQSLTVTKTIDGSGGVSNIKDQYRYTTNGGTTWSAWSINIPTFPAVVGTNIIEAQRTATGGVCDSSGTNRQTWTVTAMPTLSGPSPATQDLCLGAAVTVLSVTVNGGNGAFSYQWYSNANNNNTGGTLIPGETNPTYLPSSGAIGTTYYYCVVTQAGVGCGSVTSATASVVVAAAPQSGTVTKAPAVSGAAVCSGTTVSATATAGSGGSGTTADVLEYRYDGTGGWSSYTSGTAIPTTGHTKVEIQTYRTATGTGCTQSEPEVIEWTINPLPTVTIGINESPLTGAQDGTICTGGSVTLTGNGGGSQSPYTYIWVTGATTIATTQDVTVDPTATTDYLVTVTDKNGCTNNKPQKVVVNALPAVSIGISENPLTGTHDGTICAGGSITLTGTAGSSYAWSGGSTATTRAITITPAATTPYTITVTDANGCEGMASQTVTVNPLPVVSFTAAPGAPVCAGTDVTYTTQAGQSNYTWTLPAASEYTLTGGSLSSNTITLHWNTSGTKTVKVNYTNGDGCSATSPAMITTTVNALPTISGASLVNGVCQITTDQTTFLKYSSTTNNPTSYSIDWSATANAAGLIDQADASYSFTSGAGSITNINIPGGTLEGSHTGVLTITNNNGCFSSQAISVPISPYPFLTMDAATAPVCFNANVQSTTLAYSFAYASPTKYSITWDGTPANAFTPVSDASLAANQITIAVPAGTAAGTYTGTLVVKNAGCASVPTSFTTTVNPLPAIGSIAPATPAVCVGSNITLTNPVTGGTWTSLNPAQATVDPTTGVVTGVSAGTATIQYTTAADGNGCTNSTTTTLTVNPLPTATISGTTTVCLGSTQPVVTFTGAGGTAPYTFSYTLSDGTTTTNKTVTTTSGNSVTVPQATTTGGSFTYTLVSVKDATTTQCSQAQSGSVVITVIATATVVKPADQAFCHNATVSLAAFSGTNATSFTWTNSNTAIGLTGSGSGNLPTFTATNSGAAPISGTITVTPVNTVNGVSCNGTPQSFTITVNPLPTATISGTTAVCKDAAQPVVTFTGSRGTAPYTFTYKINGGTDQTVTTANGSSTATVPQATGTPGTYTYTLVSVKDGSTTQCVQAQSGTAVITVNPLPTATISGTTTVCLGSTQPVVTFTGAGGTAPYTFSYTLSDGTTTTNKTVTTTSGNSVTVPQATTTGGSFTYTLVSVKDATTTQCSQAQSGSVVITVIATATVVKPADQAFCHNATVSLAAFSGTNATSFTWTNSNTAIGLTGSGSGNLPTFTATNSGAAPISGTITVTPVNTVNGVSCNGTPQSFTITVNPLPTATISGTTAVCKDAAQPVVTFTGSRGTAPYTFTYKINGGTDQTVTTANGSSTATVPQATGTPGTYTYTLLSVKDGSTTQCVQAQSGTAVITVDATTVGGKITPAFTSVCANSTGGPLTLGNYTGSVIRWEYSTDGGTNWTTISNTTATQTYATVQTRLYRAFVRSGSCTGVYSDTAVVSVDPVTTPTAKANPAIICFGESSTLTATTGLPFGAWEVDGTFNQANPAGWDVTENGNPINFPANADNKSTFPWSETNGPKQPFNGGVTYNNLQTDGKFAIASGTGTSTMETPVFSTIGMTTAALEFYQALVFAAGASGKIEISTDGGNTYNRTLLQYTGPLNIGVPLNSWEKLRLDLTSYLGLSNLRIRFTYTGANNSNWALDGFKIAGPAINLNYAWTPPTGLSSTTSQTVIATPTQTTTYILGTSLNGCPGGSNPVTVTVNPLPTATMTVSTTAVCQGGASPVITFTGAKGTAPYTFTYTIDGATNTVTSSGNSATVTVPTTTAKTYVYSLVSVQDNSSTKCAQPQTASYTIKVNPLPSATIAGTTTVCQNDAAPSVTFTGSNGTAPYTFTYKINNGPNQFATTTSGNSITMSQATGTPGTFIYTLVSVQDASSTACTQAISGQTATVTVNAVTAITGQPAGPVQYCQNGGATALSVSATGTNLSYQWFSNKTNSNSGGTAIGTATNASYTPSTTTAPDTTYYYVVVTGTCGTVASNAVSVIVRPALVLSNLSSALKPCYGTSATLKFAVANATAQTTYQWFKNSTASTTGGTAISNATSASYTIPSVTPADDGYYYLVVTGEAPCNTVLTSQPIQVSSYLQNQTIWTCGSVTDEWHDDNNWTCGIPTLYKDAIVPIVSANLYPYIDGTSGLVGQTRNLTIDAGTSVTVDGLLQMAGTTITNNGVLDGLKSGTGTIEFVSNSGTFDTQYPNNTPYYNQSLVSTGGNPVTKTQNLKISNNTVSFSIPVDVYGKLSFGGSGKHLVTGDLLTLKSISEMGTAMVTDRTNASGSELNNLIDGKVTVERYIPSHGIRKWRILTSPVKSMTINGSWQEGKTWNGVTPESSNHLGTLITGGSVFPDAAAANGSGFDYWPLPAGATGSIRSYIGSSSLSSNFTAGWTDLTSTKTGNAFDSHQAYTIYIRGDRSYSTGSATNYTVLRAKGLLKEDLSYPIPVLNQSHTLIGNPYASPLDFKSIYTANSAKIQPYFWTFQSSLTGTYGYGGYVFLQPISTGSDIYEAIPSSTPGSGSAANRIIHSGEGFFVMPITDGSVSYPTNISISQTHKTTTLPGLSIFRQMGAGPSKVYVNLYVTDATGTPTLMDGALAQYDVSFANGGGYNIAKATTSGENLSVLKGGRDLIVASDKIPQEGDTLRLRIWNTASSRPYQLNVKSLNFSDIRLTAFLIDKALGTETALNLKDGTVRYDFRVSGTAAAKDPQRFYIVFRPGPPLPKVTLVSKEQRGGVRNTWAVDDETGVQTYTLERSADGTNFEKETEVSARTGSGPESYEQFDGNPLAVNFYRVRVTGTSGDVWFSDTTQVTLQNRKEAVVVYPNPVSGREVQVQLVYKPAGTYTFTLYSSGGQQVVVQKLQHTGGTVVYTLPLGGAVASGHYTLEVRNQSGAKEIIPLQVAR